MDVRVYSLEELEKHIQAIHSDGNQPSPLSPLRLQSYLNNPRARSSDPVLFELRIKNKLVAYRTLLPDTFFDARGNSHSFAWLSGNWVDPEYRRKGYSTRLLREAETGWEGRLMYTNYAPASKAVYDRRGKFPVLFERKGKRFYLRAAAEDLLAERLGARGLLRIGDQAVNRLREKKLQAFEGLDGDLCHLEKVASLNGAARDLVNRMQEGSLFRRDAEVFDWILAYPWLTEDTREALNYHFSYRAEQFENILLSFTLPDGSRGMLWMLLNNQALNVPYVFAESDLLYPCMARTLIQYMVSRNCAFTTIRHADLAEQLARFKKLFIHIRDMPQLIFAHTSIEKQVPRDREIQDGDGDVVFTG